jgi:acetoin utilization deacetylase AcuC-like enzyme
MTASLRATADGLGIPLGIVLEGGYDLGALARGVVATLAVAGAQQPPPAPKLDLHPLAERTLERLEAGRWGAGLRASSSR